MCELFAVNASKPVEVNRYLAEFYSHSHQHPDGWGICWRDESGGQRGASAPIVRYREPVPAYTSSFLPQLLERPIAARRLEAHIRRATGTPRITDNCHPFVGSDMSGREWTLIHNGILFNEELLAGYDRVEHGDTDSERTMLFLLDVLDEATLRNGGELDFGGRFEALAGALSQISNLNRLNLIIDDGDYTYVHTNTSEDTLSFRQLGPDAIVFSTQPLGGAQEADQWRPVPRNRLIAYRDGRLVRTSVPHGYVFCEALVDLYHKYGDEWTSHMSVA